MSKKQVDKKDIDPILGLLLLPNNRAQLVFADENWEKMLSGIAYDMEKLTDLNSILGEMQSTVMNQIMINEVRGAR